MKKSKLFVTLGLTSAAVIGSLFAFSNADWAVGVKAGGETTSITIEGVKIAVDYTKDSTTTRYFAGNRITNGDGNFYQITGEPTVFNLTFTGLNTFTIYDTSNNVFLGTRNDKNVFIENEMVWSINSQARIVNSDATRSLFYNTSSPRISAYKITQTYPVAFFVLPENTCVGRYTTTLAEQAWNTLTSAFGDK